jgi:flagellar hook assembly protein FlgD
MSVGTPVLANAADGLMLDSRIENGTLRLITLSLNGQTLSAGQAVLIPVTLTGAGQASLTMTDLIASSALAQTIPVQLGTVVQPVSGKGTSAPTSFSLNAASPNPFNPATTISYEVPQSAHIQLTVYNLLGQEVVRLVDQTQQPGRYQITWNALNAQGASVASGVYLYRLTSSTGYSDSRRMTLLK